MRLQLSECKLAFVDLETTGLSVDEHEIIEIGVIIYNQDTQEIEKEWETKIAPTRIETASKKALQINGYINSPELYIGKLKSALIKFNSLVKDCIVTGQNTKFDLKFIEKSMKEFGIEPSFDFRSLDLISLAWFAVKDTGAKNLSLHYLCEHFGVCNVGSHSALTDCRRTFGLYKKLEQFYKT